MMRGMGFRLLFKAQRSHAIRLAAGMFLAGMAATPVHAMQPQLWGFVPDCTALAALDARSQPITAPAESKSSMILGGAPSKLELLRAQQSAAPTPGAGPSVAASCAAPLASIAASAIATAPQIATRPAAVDSGRPDVFGSIALPVRQTPLDRRWNSIRHTRIGAGAGPWAALIRSQRSETQATQIAAVNAWVNDRIVYVDDAKAFGVADIWAGAAQSLARGRGDCEDYAIAKMQILGAMGVDPSDMYLVIARDLVRHADHAVLVVRSDHRLVVLDNGTNRVLDARDVQDYRPIMSYGAHQSWLHGYPVEPRAASAPIQTASLR
jgi:predicted transglutaminase-like cysteine proteinase